MRREIAGLLSGIVFAGASLFGGAPLRAANSSSEQAQLPAVARISVIEGGSLIVQRGDSQKQVLGVVNAPLMPGDFITTAAGTRAEVQFDGFTMLRLSQNVQARIVTDDARSHRLQVASGTVIVAVIHEESAITRIDSPSVTVRVRKPADVRISVDASGTTSVTARTGTATLETPQQDYALESGTTYVASGSASKPVITKDDEIGFDAFDDFNAQRDKTLTAALDNDANVPPGIAGYDNLNAYGRWVNVEPYGEVWTPNGVGTDWVPYRDGQWTWNAQYGWTWVSSEAWGWAPYHYGRWFYQDGYGWCWDPPAVASDPDWSPPSSVSSVTEATRRRRSRPVMDRSVGCRSPRTKRFIPGTATAQVMRRRRCRTIRPVRRIRVRATSRIPFIANRRRCARPRRSCRSATPYSAV